MKKGVLVLFVLVFMLSFVCAHQPRLVYDKASVYEEIKNPEISQAFYGELKGERDIYYINSSANFNLYLNILSPDIINTRKDFIVRVYSDEFNLTIGGGNWTLFYEEFGGDKYWRGAEIERNVSSGLYIIEVSNKGDEGRYSLAVGKIEAFGFSESLKSIWAILRLKHDFFDKSYFAFFQGIIGKGVGFLIIFVLLIIFIAVYVVRRFRGKSKRKSVKKR